MDSWFPPWDNSYNSYIQANNIYRLIIVGIDPAGIYLTLKGSNQSFINRGDATYVQIVHTDTLMFGTTLPCGMWFKIC